MIEGDVSMKVADKQAAADIAIARINGSTALSVEQKRGEVEKIVAGMERATALAQISATNTNVSLQAATDRWIADQKNKTDQSISQRETNSATMIATINSNTTLKVEDKRAAI